MYQNSSQFQYRSSADYLLRSCGFGFKLQALQLAQWVLPYCSPSYSWASEIHTTIYYIGSDLPKLSEPHCWYRCWHTLRIVLSFNKIITRRRNWPIRPCIAFAKFCGQCNTHMNMGFGCQCSHTIFCCIWRHHAFSAIGFLSCSLAWVFVKQVLRL